MNKLFWHRRTSSVEDRLASMLNIVDFQEATIRRRASSSPRAAAPVDILDISVEAVGLQSKAKDGICRAILMLDIAAQRAHQLAAYVPDPAAKQRLNAQIAIIEDLLQLAREMARDF
ncbi:MAG: hypothetical protein ABJA75_09245 [Bradyrhizobium sp.]